MAETHRTRLLIIGAGPAGYTAAIYAARAGLAPLVVAGLQPGGQLTITTDVENYPGFAEAIQGPWLMEQMQKQAEHVGARVLFDIITSVDLSRRPFVLISAEGVCPAAPPAASLANATLDECYGGKPIQLRPAALAAYRRMVAAARADPAVAPDRRNLQIFSGFRDPEADAARCAEQNNCDGLRRAVCSPHRTGTAVDLYVGHIAGLGVDDTSPASRLHMARGPVYRWLVANAGRFGFTPYVYEPWHWEWTGEPGGYHFAATAP